VYLSDQDEIFSKFRKCELTGSQSVDHTLLRLRSYIPEKKLKTLLARVSSKSGKKLKIGQNAIALKISKNVIAIIFMRGKQWIYGEYDLFSFKQLVQKKVNSIFSTENIQNVQVSVGGIKLRNSKLFKTSLYYKLRHERGLLTRRSNLKQEKILDISLSPCYRLYWDANLHFYAL
jgi:hypothetical protein